MTEVISPPPSATSPPPQSLASDIGEGSRQPLPPLVEPFSNDSLPHRFSSYPQPQSRHTSIVFPVFHSSLLYALVRDFAYPPYNPLHYGPVDELEDTPTTSGVDHDPSRRVSDPPPWDTSAGPWRDSSFDTTHQALPSTSFGPDGPDDEQGTRTSRRMSKHRKSKSYADMGDHTRGRRRNSRDGKGAAGPHNNAHNAQNYVAYFAGETEEDRNDSAYSARDSGHNRGPGYEISITGDMRYPPFCEDADSVPYSPSAVEDHRPESASLDESFAGPSLALYDFIPENDNELALKEGQVVQVGYRHGQGWLVAMHMATGEQGLIPEEYVRLLRDIEGWGDHPDDHGGVRADDTEDSD